VPRVTLPLVKVTVQAGTAALPVAGIVKVMVSGEATVVGFVATVTVSVVVLDETATGVVREPPA